jgi:hypothetical protein
MKMGRNENGTKKYLKWVQIEDFNFLSTSTFKTFALLKRRLYSLKSPLAISRI